MTERCSEPSDNHQLTAQRSSTEQFSVFQLMVLVFQPTASLFQLSVVIYAPAANFILN